MSDLTTHALGPLQADVDIFCSHLERSIRFYCDVLGLRVAHQSAGTVQLEGGEGRWLTLYRVSPLDDAAMSQLGRHTGATFAVADLETVFEDLQCEGVQFVSRPCRQPWGQTMVNFTDPDGNVLTLLQRRSTLRDWSASPQAGDGGTVAA